MEATSTTKKLVSVYLDHSSRVDFAADSLQDAKRQASDLAGYSINLYKRKSEAPHFSFVMDNAWEVLSSEKDLQLHAFPDQPGFSPNASPVPSHLPWVRQDVSDSACKIRPSPHSHIPSQPTHGPNDRGVRRVHTLEDVRHGHPPSASQPPRYPSNTSSRTHSSSHEIDKVHGSLSEKGQGRRAYLAWSEADDQYGWAIASPGLDRPCFEPTPPSSTSPAFDSFLAIEKSPQAHHSPLLTPPDSRRGSVVDDLNATARGHDWRGSVDVPETCRSPSADTWGDVVSPYFSRQTTKTLVDKAGLEVDTVPSSIEAVWKVASSSGSLVELLERQAIETEESMKRKLCGNSRSLMASLKTKANASTSALRSSTLSSNFLDYDATYDSFWGSTRLEPVEVQNAFRNTSINKRLAEPDVTSITVALHKAKTSKNLRQQAQEDMSSTHSRPSSPSVIRESCRRPAENYVGPKPTRKPSMDLRKDASLSPIGSPIRTPTSQVNSPKSREFRRSTSSEWSVVTESSY